MLDVELLGSFHAVLFFFSSWCSQSSKEMFATMIKE